MNNITDRRTRQVETFDGRGGFFEGRPSMKGRPPPVLPNDVGQLIRGDFPLLWRAHQERPLRTSKAAGALGEGMGHIRQSVPIRILPDHLANGVGSREAARLVRCRVRTGAPDGRAPGKMRSGVQPTSGGQPRSPSEVVERDWWAARILGVRSRRRRQLGGRAARRERGGRPQILAWTWPGGRTLLFWLRARACDRFPVR